MGTGEGEREGGSEEKRLRLQAAPGPLLGWIRGARSQYRAVPPPRGGRLLPAPSPSLPLSLPLPLPGAALASPSAPAAEGWGARPLPAETGSGEPAQSAAVGTSPGDAADTGTEPVLLLPRANESDARIWCEGSSRV